jgi:predicted nucleotidyltransferase component of viral defense system
VTPKSGAWLARRESSPASWSWRELQEAVAQAFSTAADLSGIDLSAQEPRVRIIEEEYGRETLRLTHYWRGPHTTAGSPPGIRLDITRDEVVAFDPALRSVVHPFSDFENLAPLRIRCYALEEVMAEKVRAVLGQRIFPVSRDLYDIFSLLDQVDERRVLGVLPKKLDVRGLGPEEIGAGRLIDRREEFRADWERNLVHLLPPGGEKGFDEVWDPVSEFIARVIASLQ